MGFLQTRIKLTIKRKPNIVPGKFCGLAHIYIQIKIKIKMVLQGNKEKKVSVVEVDKISFNNRIFHRKRTTEIRITPISNEGSTS